MRPGRWILYNKNFTLLIQHISVQMLFAQAYIKFIIFMHALTKPKLIVMEHMQPKEKAMSNLPKLVTRNRVP